MDFKSVLSFRVKLLLAMMVVVVAITGATLYLAENNLQSKHQEKGHLRRAFPALRFIDIPDFNDHKQ